MVGGKADFGYAIEYSKKYTTRFDPNDPSVSLGRFSTLVNTFKILKDSGFAQLSLGFGPGAYSYSILDKSIDPRLAKLKAGYGMTPLTYIVIEYGILGLITYGLIIVTFLCMCWKYYFYETDPYWRAFAAGSLGLALFMVFLFCAYNHNSVSGDSFPLLYFYIMGVVFVRMKKD
jgi:hypothetical protein